jgi:hypothetical protein
LFRSWIFSFDFNQFIPTSCRRKELQSSYASTGKDASTALLAVVRESASTEDAKEFANWDAEDTTFAFTEDSQADVLKGRVKAVECANIQNKREIA